MAEPVCVVSLAPAGDPEGVALLFCHLPAETRAAERDRLLREGDRHRLILARRGQRLVGASLATLLPGRYGVVAAPQLVAGGPLDTGRLLAESAAEDLASRGAAVAQGLLDIGAADDIRHFAGAGYQHLASLVYLADREGPLADERAPAAAAAVGEPQVDFVPVAFDDRGWRRLIEVVDRTYEGTLDCPGLNGVRKTRDVLEGYRHGAQFVPEGWLLVRDGVRDADHGAGRGDIGCLILARHEEGLFELVYMGLVPEARGRGLGLSITRHAQQLARQLGGKQLILAVDAKNAPARALYARAGFLPIEIKEAYFKVL
ncbi:MAG: GNAT family N-acetyltransferase [Planctomycetia bacterium]|nr:GNAT family N-acetyltransferase [Planctomycetia bacterium]